MPYIKRELRPQFDEVIKGLRKSESGTRAVGLMMIALKSRKDTEIDGCLNYVFTQILRHNHYIFEWEGLFIRSVINRVYLNPPKYYKLNAVDGLISRIRKELVRRDWLTPQASGFLSELEHLIDVTYYIPYEDKKIKENGDLEDVV